MSEKAEIQAQSPTLPARPEPVDQDRPKASGANRDWAGFQIELRAKEREIASLLPPSIPRERFFNAAIVAVKKNPDLLMCERRSLHNAVSSAAGDGLLPDGREGVIIVQSEKIKVKQSNGIEKEEWIKTARWQPMAWGIRKRARELDDIIIDAEVVHEADAFDWEKGDDPFIKHKPAPLNVARGKMIGAYAIFRKGDAILHREVMYADQIAAVKSSSKNPKGLLWTTFEDEGWRKSVLRRGSKSVPCSEKLETVINRWDDLFDVDAQATPQIDPPRATAPIVLPPIRSRAAIAAPSETPVPPHPVAPTTAEPARMPPVRNSHHVPEASCSSERSLLQRVAREMSEAQSKEDVEGVWQQYEPAFEGKGRAFMQAAEAHYDRHIERVTQGRVE